MLRHTGILSLLFASICVAAFGQQAPEPSTATQKLNEWRNSRVQSLMNDWGELARYREANAQLAPPAPGDKRVVFFGDSITDMWNIAESFPGKPYVNRGIGGQTTPQMLVRFRSDVIDLKPAVVVILAGTNDIAGNTGPMTLQEIEANYASMAELARVHGVRVVFSSVMPVHNYTPRAADFFATRPMEKILELNRWLKNYCAPDPSSCLYLDYFSGMVDDKGLLRRELSEDGLHPNDAGYKIMARLAASAIDRAISTAKSRK